MCSYISNILFHDSILTFINNFLEDIISNIIWSSVTLDPSDRSLDTDELVYFQVYNW
jgi:hypothetical protein